MAKTLQERFQQALTQRGETHVKTTARYRVYTRTRSLATNEPVAPGTYYYLGACGALRVGTSAATSRPVIDRLRDQLLAPAQAPQTASAPSNPTA